VVVMTEEFCLFVDERNHRVTALPLVLAYLR